MARNSTVWGIDIGNSSLKALRCRAGEEPGSIEAVGFDFIEHSKILSQPGSDPLEILTETLGTFLSRNETQGDKVAISVSGQNTISRFLKLPPVDSKKIPDIIKFEAKQWLPFDLEDVIWSYQPIGAVNVEQGIVMDSEIGMFAMKRDIAAKTIQPYIDAGIDIDCIQSTPLAIYNYVAHDQLKTKDMGEVDPRNPPESLIVLSVGTDATDVIVTNGISIWTRSIPIGGNLFTKALTKGLKLTFSKAEYLKRNPTTATDPKAVFQAMKPVFNDMLNEVHRSIEFYSNLNRRAKFSKVLAVGNAMKMPGLRQFLSQNLGFEVLRPTGFARLVGDDVVRTPVFIENAISFPVSYGLVIQLLGESVLSTNLMPREVVVDRIIREKKPWALTAAAAILLGLTIQFTGAARALDGINRGEYGSARSQADSVKSKADGFKTAETAAISEFDKLDLVGKNLTSNVEGRVTWLELLKIINEAVPKYSSAEDEAISKSIVDARLRDHKVPLTEKELRQEIIHRQNRIYISNIDVQPIPDAAPWWEVMSGSSLKWYLPDESEFEFDQPVAPPADATEDVLEKYNKDLAEWKVKFDAMSEEDRLKLLPGPPKATPCKLVQIVGHHYHNSSDDKENFGANYVRRTLIHGLKYNTVMLPASMAAQLGSVNMVQTIPVTMQEAGIYYPTLIRPRSPIDVNILDPDAVRELQNEKIREMLNKGGPNALGSSRASGWGGGIGSDVGGYGFDTNLFSRGPGSKRTSKNASPGSGNVLEGMASSMGSDEMLQLRRYDFVVQFIWIETPPNAREKQKAAAEAEANDGKPAASSNEESEG